MKLLILSPDAYSVFHTDTKCVFGGIEIETGHHAIGLSELGVEVHVLTRDQGEPTHLFGSIYLHPISELKGKRYWEKRKTWSGRLKYRFCGDQNRKSIEELCEEIDPDCYYVMGMSGEALRIARCAKKKGKKFVFRAAHDRDLGDEIFSSKGMEEWARITKVDVCEIINAAEVLIAQTPLQQELFRTRFKRSSVQMFPPIVIEPIASVVKKYDALWIGRTNSFKRPEELLKLAKGLPGGKFCMVLNRVSEDEWNAVANQVTPNIELIESVPSDAIEEYFRMSKLYISTSLHEGFPNTFLQAAKNGVPVLAMGSDPNNMLTVHNAGRLVGDDSEQLAVSMNEFLNDEKLYGDVSRSARRYVEAYNDRNVISQQLVQLIQPADVKLKL